VIDSYDALVNLLESIEHFLGRLDIYIQIPPSPAMDEMVVKIIVESISTLAVATRELKQGRTSRLLLMLLPLHSALRSICKESFWREGR
jgi:hypothetical protein